MDHEFSSNDTTWRSLLKTIRNTVVIIVLVITLIVIATLSIDTLCYNTLTLRLPLYPDAEQIMARHNFLRQFGMGETVIVLQTEDTPDVVREWYGRTIGETAQQHENDPFFYGFTSANWSVTRAEDGEGTQIILSGVCAS